MGQVGRLAGAVLARSGERWFLVGEPKVPLDLAAHGFREVGRLAHGGHEIIELAREGPAAGEPARAPAPGGAEAPALPLTMPLEGEALARRLHDIFVITRNNSVSERLFRFLDAAQRGSPDLTWLALAPPEAIALMREGLLKCS